MWEFFNQHWLKLSYAKVSLWGFLHPPAEQWVKLYVSINNNAKEIIFVFSFWAGMPILDMKFCTTSVRVKLRRSAHLIHRDRKTEGELSGVWLYYVLWSKVCCTTIFKKRLKSVSNTQCMAYSSIITAVLPGIRVISRDRKAVHLLCHTVVWVSHESPGKFRCRQNSWTEKLLFHSTSPSPSVTIEQTTKYAVTIIREAVTKYLFRDDFLISRRNSPA